MSDSLVSLANRQDKNQIVRLTPPGRSAVASVRLLGPQSWQFLRQYFTPQGSNSPVPRASDRIRVGSWQHAPGIVEHVVVHVRSKCECTIHCHGGHGAIHSIMTAAVRQGWQELTWEQYVEHGESDRVRAEALQTLPQALTTRTALSLLDQLHGALSQKALDLLARVAEERPCPPFGEAVSGNVKMPGGIVSPEGTTDWESLCQELRELRDTAHFGTHLIHPWRVVVGGPTNVGKSSLINQLVGFERAVVYDQPGTTRDVVRCLSAMAGWPVEFADTAGYREDARDVEQQGILKAQMAWNTADLRILVADLSARYNTTAGANRITPRLQPDVPQGWSPPEIVVWNKIDLLPRPGGIGAPGVCFTCAKSGDGCQALLLEMERLLLPAAPQRAAPILFTERQWLCVEQALEAAQRRDAVKVRTALGQLLWPTA